MQSDKSTGPGLPSRHSSRTCAIGGSREARCNRLACPFGSASSAGSSGSARLSVSAREKRSGALMPCSGTDRCVLKLRAATGTLLLSHRIAVDRKGMHGCQCNDCHGQGVDKTVDALILLAVLFLYRLTIYRSSVIGVIQMKYGESLFRILRVV